MKSLAISIILIGLVSASCTKEAALSPGTYEYFKAHIRSDMDYDNLVLAFGTPDDDMGSGIHIYVYNLKDGTAIIIGFSDRIHYAKHMDSNGQLLHTLI